MANLKDTMFCWNPGGNVVLIPWPDESGLGRAYRRSGGACYAHIRDMDFEERKTIAFVEAVVLIVRDGCAPETVHQAFLGLDEYVDGLPDDMLPKSLLAKRWEKENK